MGVLEQVIKMKNQGASESQIIRELSQNRVSPREIQDALRQAQIKTAVSGVSEMDDGMQPSIMQEGIPSPNASQETYTPHEDYEPQEQQYAPQQEYAPQEQQYYQQEQYPSQGYAPQTQTSDADTIIEIADQVFSDRSKKIQKQVESSAEAMVLLQSKFESLSERLKKIEMVIDKLQIAILEKVGSYGSNLESIKKEMSMMQDSFSKMISPSSRRQRETNDYENPMSSENETESEEAFSAPVARKKISKRR